MDLISLWTFFPSGRYVRGPFFRIRKMTSYNKLQHIVLVLASVQWSHKLSVQRRVFLVNESRQTMWATERRRQCTVITYITRVKTFIFSSTPQLQDAYVNNGRRVSWSFITHLRVFSGHLLYYDMIKLPTAGYSDDFRGHVDNEFGNRVIVRYIHCMNHNADYHCQRPNQNLKGIEAAQEHCSLHYIALH